MAARKLFYQLASYTTSGEEIYYNTASRDLNYMVHPEHLNPENISLCNFRNNSIYSESVSAGCVFISKVVCIQM
jgi:hypothetical protein